MLVIKGWIVLVSRLFTISVSISVSFPTFVIATTSSSHFVRNINLFCYLIPNFVYTVSIIESFKNSIATNHNVIKIILNFESSNIRLANNYIRVSTVLWTFCFYVSKGLGYTQSTWKYSQWSLNIQIFFTWMCCSFCKCLGSVNLTSSSLNPNLF